MNGRLVFDFRLSFKEPKNIIARAWLSNGGGGARNFKIRQQTRKFMINNFFLVTKLTKMGYKFAINVFCSPPTWKDLCGRSWSRFRVAERISCKNGRSQYRLRDVGNQWRSQKLVLGVQFGKIVPKKSVLSSTKKILISM